MKVFMPGFREHRTVLCHEFPNSSELRRRQSFRICQFRKILEPPLGVTVSLFHVDVRRLEPLIAEEKEAESLNDEHRWHETVWHGI
jgi:hypothetical protein